MDMSSESQIGDSIDVAVFDMDGTLIENDSLFVQLSHLLHRSIFSLPNLLGIFILSGRAGLKKSVNDMLKSVDKNGKWLEDIVVNDQVLKELRSYEKDELDIVIATAAYRDTAEAVLNKIGVNPLELIASDGKANLRAEKKLDAVRKVTGERRWLYYGDSSADLSLLKAADTGYLVKKSSVELFKK